MKPESVRRLFVVLGIAAYVWPCVCIAVTAPLVALGRLVLPETSPFGIALLGAGMAAATWASVWVYRKAYPRPTAQAGDAEGVDVPGPA